jgi:hypothetical protein
MSRDEDEGMPIVTIIVLVLVCTVLAALSYWGYFYNHVDVKGQIINAKFMQHIWLKNSTCLTFILGGGSGSESYCFITQNTTFVDNFINSTYFTSNSVCDLKTLGVNFQSLKCSR